MPERLHRRLPPAAQAPDTGPSRPPAIEAPGSKLLTRPDELTPQTKLTFLLVFVARRWRSLLDDRLRRMGQTAARMEALSTIAHSPPESAQTAIARRIGIEGATLTRMLDSLEADALVARIPHPSDRRTKHLRLTDAGEAQLAKMMAAGDVLRARLLDGLGGDELEAANAFLLTLLGRMDGDLED